MFNDACIKITTNNTTIDCQNYNISVSGGALIEGISVRSNINNLVVQNCGIISTVYGFNLLGTSIDNLTIQNSEFRKV